MPGSDTSTRRPKASARGAAAHRPTPDALTDRECAVVVRLQRDTIPAIAADLGVSERQVRRLRASARKHGAILQPPEPKPQNPATGAFESPSKPRGRVRVIGLTGGGGHAAEMHFPARRESGESREDFDRRTGRAGRHGLGREYEVGDLERDDQGRATGRVLIGKQMISDEGERSRAMDAFIPPLIPEGATEAILVYEDGSERKVRIAR